MVDVAIYQAHRFGFLKELDRVPDIDTLDEARVVLMELYDGFVGSPGWNVRTAGVNSSFTEGHVYGFCADEHYMLTLEDSGQKTTMEAWNERIKARLELLDK